MASFTTFFDLARELRQQILLETYDVESDTSPENRDLFFPMEFDPKTWKFREHKERIDAWTAVLRKVDDNIDFTEDVKFVKQKWLDQLLVVRDNKEKFMEEKWEEWSMDPNVVWKMTREGEPPWCQLAGCLHSARHFCRRELRVRDLNEVLQFDEDDVVWDHGTSGVRWDMDGWGHRRSDWDTLGVAADQDIKWLTKWIRQYHSRFPKHYRRIPLPAEFEDPIPEYSGYKAARRRRKRM